MNKDITIISRKVIDVSKIESKYKMNKCTYIVESNFDKSTKLADLLYRIANQKILCK